MFIIKRTAWLNMFIIKRTAWLNMFIIKRTAWLNMFIIKRTAWLIIFIIKHTARLNMFIIKRTAWLNMFIIKLAFGHPIIVKTVASIDLVTLQTVVLVPAVADLNNVKSGFCTITSQFGWHSKFRKDINV
jgi:hypothetical protein